MSADRYGSTAAKTDEGIPHVVTNNFIVTLGFLVGACGLAVMGMSLTLKPEEFFNFGNFALATLEQSPVLIWSGWALLGLGFVGILSGMLLGVAGLLSREAPWLTHFALFILFVNCVGQLAGGVLVTQASGLVNAAIYDQPLTDPEEGSFTSRVIHFQYAMFNECCASQGYTEEVYSNEDFPDAEDSDGFVKFCDNLHPENLRAMESAFDLRTCFLHQEDYRRFNFTVVANRERICRTMENARVDIDGYDIPGTSIEVKSQTGGQTVIPIVGEHETNYGCGLGYAKAFQAAQLVWVQNKLFPISTAFIAVSVVQIVLLLVALATLYACNYSGESAEHAYDRYMQDINTNSQAGSRVHDSMGTAGGITGVFEETNPNRPLSVNNPVHVQGYDSQRSSLQSTGSAGFVPMAQPVVAHSPAPLKGGMVAFNVDDKI